VIGLYVMNEGGINGPMNIRNRSGCEVGIKRNALINQRNSTLGANHPLNVCGRCGNALDLRVDSNVCQHLD
jgi:hypothetical protein